MRAICPLRGITMGKVNPDLYDFLKENETGLYTQEFHKNKTVFAYVHIDFCDLSKFVGIVGSHHFEERGMKVTMLENTVAVDLNDIIECDDDYLSDYKNCFCEHDWKHYEDQIKEMES